MGQISEAIKTTSQANAPVVRRSQIINFIIMLLIIASIVFLAFEGIIDGSAATGLLGAIVGYVFGTLYEKRVLIENE